MTPDFTFSSDSEFFIAVSELFWWLTFSLLKIIFYTLNVSNVSLQTLDRVVGFSMGVANPLLFQFLHGKHLESIIKAPFNAFSMAKKIELFESSTMFLVLWLFTNLLSELYPFYF